MPGLCRMQQSVGLYTVAERRLIQQQGVGSHTAAGRRLIFLDKIYGR